MKTVNNCVFPYHSVTCFLQILQKEDAIEWPGTLAIVHSYISYKAGEEFHIYARTVNLQ